MDFKEQFTNTVRIAVFPVIPNLSINFLVHPSDLPELIVFDTRHSLPKNYKVYSDVTVCG